MGADLKRRIEGLSPGEIDALRLAAQHLRSPEIGHRLGISPKTVDNRISRAMKRLEVSDRDSAIRLLLEAAQTPWGKSLGLFPGLGDAGHSSPSAAAPRLPLPWPTRWRPENDHDFSVKLVMILVLAAAMMLIVAAYLAAVILVDRGFPRS